jgi:hypothetical protein
VRYLLLAHAKIGAAVLDQRIDLGKASLIQKKCNTLASSQLHIKTGKDLVSESIPNGGGRRRKTHPNLSLLVLCLNASFAATKNRSFLQATHFGTNIKRNRGCASNM